MYHAGELQLRLRRDPPDYWDPEIPFPTAFLPHSCDEWIIGGKEEIRCLIADLQAALETFERLKL